MTWSLSAHGFLGDVTAAENLMRKLGEVLSDATSGTMGSSFSAPGVSSENFHLALTPADDAVNPQVPAPSEQGAEDGTNHPAEEPSQATGESPGAVTVPEPTPQD